MFYTIYRITNTVNGKYYIGKHQTKDLDDGYMGSGKLLRAAIKKYGKENFHKEILHVVQTEKEMDLLEKILVVPDIETNYNLCDGGKGGWSYLNRLGLSVPITKQKIDKEKARKSNSLKRKQAWQSGKYDTVDFSSSGFTNKTHTTETKLKISKGGLKRFSDKNGSFGTCWITNNLVNKKIKKEELDNWLELGYHKGRI